MATASTTAWVLHDLGLAAGFGGSLFGQMALNPAVKQVSSRTERARVLDEAWNDFKIVHGVSLGLMAASWFAGRSLVSGRLAGRDIHRLVIAKDALVGATVITGVASTVGGAILARENERTQAPIESGNQPAGETPERIKTLQRFVNIVGRANLVTMAAAIGVTTVLAMKSGKSSRWSLISRLLP